MKLPKNTSVAAMYEDYFSRRQNPSPPESIKKARKLGNLLFQFPKYVNSVTEVNQLLDDALAQVGLRLVHYIDTAVPYGQSRQFLLQTTDPNIIVAVQLYRNEETGSYELTSYASHDARRRRNPEGDHEHEVAHFIAHYVAPNMVAGQTVSVPVARGLRVEVTCLEKANQRAWRAEIHERVLLNLTDDGETVLEERTNDLDTGEQYTLEDFEEALHQILHQVIDAEGYQKKNPAKFKKFGKDDRESFPDYHHYAPAVHEFRNGPNHKVRMWLVGNGSFRVEHVDDKTGETTVLGHVYERTRDQWFKSLGVRTEERKRGLLNYYGGSPFIYEAVDEFGGKHGYWLGSTPISAAQEAARALVRGLRKKARLSNPSDEPPTELPGEEIEAGTGEPMPEIVDRPEEADRIYEEFHGAPSEEEILAEEEIQIRENLGVLGRLVQIVCECVADSQAYKINFGEDVMLCASADGRQLYVVGGDQSLDLAAMGFSAEQQQKDKVFIGPAQQVTYRTRKHFDDFAEIDYVHDFGEDGGTLPALVYDRLNQTIEFAGGDYEIKPEGIVN